MIFKRTQHDGLHGVIHRQGFKKIVFTAGQYETEDPEECKTLVEMGYAYEGEMPGETQQPQEKPNRPNYQGNKGK